MLQTQNLCKRFADMYALKDVSLAILPGEIHGLVGENGAGKSTLIKILTGVYSLDSGEIFWQGKAVTIQTPLESRVLGINVIHQDRNLVPKFNGVENIYLGLPYPQTAGLAVNWKKMRQKAEALIQELGIEIDLQKLASELSPPEKTMLEIARAMMTDCKLLILDEPTASLTDKEANLLFDIIHKLKAKGTSILYVTHRMDEIFQLTDRITIFKNGQLVETVETAHETKEQIIAKMSDNWSSQPLDETRNFGKPMLEVSDLKSKDGTVKQAAFTVHAGEILGVFGLGGSGRTEMLECIYGMRPMQAGTVAVDGKVITHHEPGHALKEGMVLICEDRRGMALVPSRSVEENTMLSTLENYTGILGIMDAKKERKDTLDKIDSLRIKTEGPKQPVYQLSGGNQQKVVFAKALLSNPKVLLCDEPTQAVDVKTRSEIHRLLREMADGGSGVVFVSSDLKEVLEVADRIQVVAHGKTCECFENKEITAQQVLSCCYAE